MSLKYRRDIDGLRAVAVLTVILYHLGLPIHFDGFVGVDIFFVISGFLITGILYKQISTGTFSITSFYARRVKRILPALYLVVFVTVVVGAALMLPGDLKEVAKSSFASILSASNVYFWYSEDTSYFARSSELIPLLHTWSLGVEEQFYFCWPFLVVIAYKVSGFRGVVIASMCIAVAAYSYSEALLTTDASFSYYMILSRAGELLTGAIAFLGVVRESEAKQARLPAFVLEFMALTGALLIAYSLLFANVSSSFPGVNAIYPCVGAALIIYAGSYRLTFISRVLALPPFVGIGLISYSLYLWHWPVLAYLRYLYASLSTTMIIASIVIMSVASILSYKLVEVPFRVRQISDRSAFVYYLVVPALVLVPSTLLLYKTNGLEQVIASNPEYSAALKEQQEYAEPAYRYDYVCQTDEHSNQTFDGNRCVIGSPDNEPHILLWGDSHAAHHVGFFAELGERKGFSVRNLEVGNCPPVLRADIEYVRPQSVRACAEFRAKISKILPDYEYVVLGGAWSAYFIHDKFESDLRETVSYLVGLGRKVALLGQVPLFENYDRNCLLRNSRYLYVACEKHALQPVHHYYPENQLVKKIAAEYDNVTFFYIGDHVCDPKCSPYRDGKPIYFDQGHLSIHGSRWLGERYFDYAPSFLAGDLTRTGLMH